MSSNTSSDADFDNVLTPSTSTTIDADGANNSSIQALQSAEQRRVLDVVDELGRTGLSGIVELPQLIVCGDQSSGKSSVLEAITEIPFPRKGNLCTRFATQISLRRSKSSTSTVTINPDKLRPSQEQEKLKLFRKTIDDFSKLPELIEEATQEMGLGVVGGINSRAFSRDVLSIEITGPDRPHLTVVDLPGLIHATNKAQTENDKGLILDLVKQYMKNSRTIILAVVTAKNDYANQIVLDYCRKIDEQGRRTLGIITKPDFLREGSENEKSWIDLAQNKDIYLQRGWHMLKNREEHQMEFSFAERNEDERVFFSKGRYASLPRDQVGINPLRERLSRLLFQHLMKELPSLKAEITSKLEDTTSEIEKLGEKRTTPHEQRKALMRISESVKDVLKSALSGSYESQFFGTIDLDAPVDATENICRFRAVVQHVNIAFANDMRLRGHKYAFEAGPGDDASDIDEDMRAEEDLEELEEDENIALLPTPQKMTRSEAIEWVKKTLERSRGYELPGTFQPMVISQLFWQQSKPWEELALEHVNRVAHKCKDFVYKVIEAMAPPEFQDRLISSSVDAALAQSLKAAKEELAKILKDKSRHPITYNHSFNKNVQKMRRRKQQVREAQASRHENSNIAERHGLKPLVLPMMRRGSDSSIELDIDAISSQDALDTQRAYYKDEIRYFIDSVAKTVIERHLVGPLPDIIIAPMMVTGMTDQEVQYIAAESADVTQKRDHLESLKKVLEAGLDTFRDVLGSLRR